MSSSHDLQDTATKSIQMFRVQAGTIQVAGDDGMAAERVVVVQLRTMQVGTPVEATTRETEEFVVTPQQARDLAEHLLTAAEHQA